MPELPDNSTKNKQDGEYFHNLSTDFKLLYSAEFNLSKKGKRN